MEVGSVTVGEGLIKNQVGQLQTTERRGVGKTCVETDGAVRDVDAVPADAPAQREKRHGRVAEDAGLARVVFEEVLIARPEQDLCGRVARVLVVFETGVDVERVLIFVPERKLTEELKVRGWHGVVEGLSEFDEVVFGANLNGCAGVLPNGRFAADGDVQPEHFASVSKIQKHLLVIAAQTEDAVGLCLLERDYICDDARYLVAAINQVA